MRNWRTKTQNSLGHRRRGPEINWADSEGTSWDSEHLASKEDLAQMERMVKWGVALVAVAVALNNFLQWVIR